MIEHWLAGQYELVISAHILEEIRRTLAKPYFSRFLTLEDQAAGAVERLSAPCHGGSHHRDH